MARNIMISNRKRLQIKAYYEIGMEQKTIPVAVRLGVSLVYPKLSTAFKKLGISRQEHAVVLQG